MRSGAGAPRAKEITASDTDASVVDRRPRATAERSPSAVFTRPRFARANLGLAHDRAYAKYVSSSE
jgi:hypothetical protein